MISSKKSMQHGMQHENEKSPHFCGLSHGVDENRTRVRRPIHCPSTIIVGYLTFPPAAGSQHPSAFSSFMIRPYAQSLAYVVSHIIDARVLKCECLRSDSSHQAASAKLSSAFIFRFCDLAHRLRIASPASQPPSKPVLARDKADPVCGGPDRFGDIYDTLP